jgi:hypothetical protein
VATAVSLAVITIAVIVVGSLLVDWETPYRDTSKVAKSIESRIHIGKTPSTPVVNVSHPVITRSPLQRDAAHPPRR